MHLTPSFPEHKSSGLPRFPLNGPSAPRLSDKVVLAGSNNHIYCPTPAPSSLLHPEWHRMSRDPGSGSQGTAVLSKASDGRGRGEPSEPPRHPSRFCEPAGGREGDPGRERAGGGSARTRGGKAAMAAQVTVPTAATGSPRWRASSARVEGSFGETESKSPGGGGGGAGGPGGAVRTARESVGARGDARYGAGCRRSSRGKLAREALAAHVLPACRLLRGLGDPCGSRSWADRALSTELAGRGLCKTARQKSDPGLPSANLSRALKIRLRA